MTSAKLIRAAQTNGKKSHGPRTPKGKRRSAANSLQHGLYAKQLPFDPQCQRLALTLQHAYTNEFHPQSPHESHLIAAIAQAEAQHHWAERIAAQILDAAIAKEAQAAPTLPRSWDKAETLQYRYWRQSLQLRTRLRKSQERTESPHPPKAQVTSAPKRNIILGVHPTGNR